MILNKVREDGTLVVSILGEIFGGYDELILESVLSEAPEGQPLEVWIASPGGDLQAAFPMVASLSAYSGKKEIHTCGIVASAATLILCADGAKVIAHSGSVFMLHQSLTYMTGNSNDARKAAEMLDACDSEIVEVLRSRVGKSQEELLDMLKSETWLNAKQALDIGLVDEIASASSSGEVADIASAVAARESEQPEQDEADEKSAVIDDIRASVLSISCKVDSLANSSHDEQLVSLKEAVSGITCQLKELSEARKASDEKLEKFSAALSRVVADRYGADAVHISNPGPSARSSFKLSI